MYTFGYLREATQAHIDLDEQETQAMHLQERYHIYANEAMQAICAVKPKYTYFNCKVVESYKPLVEDTQGIREATEEEIEWKVHNLDKPFFLDDVETRRWYESKNIFILKQDVRMPTDFLVFAEKQAYIFREPKRFDSELFIRGRRHKAAYEKERATGNDFSYSGSNTVRFHELGEYWIPYKAFWFRFKSGIGDDTEIDIPIDIFLTIPLYIASQCLQIDHIQRANAKRSEFEVALSRCNNTDFLDMREVIPSFK